MNNGERKDQFEGVLKAALPLLLAGILLLFLSLLLPRQGLYTMMGLIFLYMIPPLGKESVIPMGIGLGIPWWLMALTMTVLDLLGGLFVTWNFYFSCRIPYLGPWIARTMKGGRAFFDARPWLERLYFIGLILFVMVPFESSGGISAAILGRMMGMRPVHVIACIAIGAGISCTAIALASDTVILLLKTDIVLGIIAILIILFACGVCVIIWHAAKKRQHWSGNEQG
ncbi:MAG: small multi-drug export protein [Methanomicrobiaceae archaeon]|nr:small multi-drug export protein [Methanomicrobiaceae archaeon]